MKIIAIDPGVKSCGLAMFYNGLIFARSIKTDEVSGYIKQAELIVCEMPQAYRGRAARGDTNDLLNLARVVGMIEALAHVARVRIKTPRPREWKGQVPKDIMCRRAWSALTISERAKVEISQTALTIIEKGGKIPKRATDVLDAIGLGLWA